MSRQVSQILKTGRYFPNNVDTQTPKMNSRGDALDYRRTEQIGLEAMAFKQNNPSYVGALGSSGFEGSLGPNGNVEPQKILDNRSNIRVHDQPNYIGEMKVSEPFKRRNTFQGPTNQRIDNQSFSNNRGQHERRGTNFMVIKSKDCTDGKNSVITSLNEEMETEEILFRDFLFSGDCLHRTGNNVIM